MPRHFFHTALFSSVAATLAMLATTAHGTAIIRARVDPPAVAGIPVPGYDGYADFEFSDACLVGDGWKSVNSFSDCGFVSMYDSEIYLYGDDPGQGPGNSEHRDTLRFDSFLIEEDAIFGIYVSGGKIAGIDMSPVSPYSGPSGDYEGSDFLFKLGTNCGGVALCPGFAPFASLANETEPENGLRARITFEDDLRGPTEPGESVFAGPTAVIPEPGTLSLLLAALGGAWLARGRSKPTQ